MVGCFLAACLGSWMFLEVWPSVFDEGRLWTVVPVAPLTALATVIAGTSWTRRVRPSSVETIGALLAVESIILGIVAFVGGALFMSTTFLFWAVVSLPFAPWWLLGFWIGRAMTRKLHD
jgi:hypothetical protein